MKIIKFDTQNGIYNFQLNELEAEMHAHPMVEVILGLEGDFSVETNDSQYTELNFLLIDANIKHRVFSKECKVQMLMLESNNALLAEFLNLYDLKEENGLFIASDNFDETDFLKAILTFVEEHNINSNFYKRSM